VGGGTRGVVKEERQKGWGMGHESGEYVGNCGNRRVGMGSIKRE